MATTIVLAPMMALPGDVVAESDSTIIPADGFYAIVFEMSEGVELEFNVTSDVAIYIAVLDDDTYQAYAAGGTVSTWLYITTSAVTTAEANVEAPEDGEYYLLMENSESSSPASVTVDYEFHGTGISLGGLAYAMIIGGVVGAVVAAVVAAAIMKKRKARKNEPVTNTLPEGTKDELNPPPQIPM